MKKLANVSSQLKMFILLILFCLLFMGCGTDVCEEFGVPEEYRYIFEELYARGDVKNLEDFEAMIERGDIEIVENAEDDKGSDTEVNEDTENVCEESYCNFKEGSRLGELVIIAIDEVNFNGFYLRAITAYDETEKVMYQILIRESASGVGITMETLGKADGTPRLYSGDE